MCLNELRLFVSCAFCCGFLCHNVKHIVQLIAGKAQLSGFGSGLRKKLFDTS